MGKPFRPPELALAGLVVMSAAVLFSVLPPFAGMALAVIAAVSWCIWLDQHPTS
jgi:dolichol kinase